MIDLYGELRAVNRALALAGRQHGEMRKLRAEWLPVGDNQPRTDMSTGVIYIPQPSPYGTKSDLLRSLGEVWHEGGHHHPKQHALVDLMRKEGIGFGTPLGNKINAIDDIWQERESTLLYAGAAKALDFMQGDCVAKANELLKSGANVDQDAVDTLGLCYQARKHWQPSVSRNVDEYMKYVKTDYSHHLPAIDNLHNLTGEEAAAEVVRIAREMTEQQGEDPDSPEQKGGEPEQGEGESSEGGGGAQEESQAGEGEEGKEKKAKGGDISYKELMGHTHGEDGGEDGSHGNIIYDHDRLDDYVPHDTVTSELSDLHPGTMSRDMLALYERTQKVKQTVLRLFQAASQTRKVHQQKRGKLTSKHLVRGVSGDPRIFYKKNNKIDDKAEVSILIDRSGSMRRHDKFEYAVVAATNLNDVLQIAGVPTRVATFNERWSECREDILKDWNERPTPKTIIERAGAGPSGANADGDSLLQAYRDLMTRKGNRKILIVLSDGEPATCQSGDAWTFTKKVIESISRNVEVYGVGILDRSVEDLYPHHTVLSDPNEIEQCIVNVVKEKILR